MTILLIEDNPADVELIREMLSNQKGSSFNIINADRLSVAKPYLTDDRIDIILLDLGLPDSQGLDTLRRVRDYAREVPIVVLTMLDNEETGLTALKEGAQDYLVKGQMNGPLIARSLHYAIERGRIEKELKKHRDSLEELVSERTIQLASVNEELRQQYSALATKDEAIQALNRNLEKRVEERTSELKKANTELENAQEELHAQYYELVEREKLLAESEERFRISAQSVSDVIWDWNIINGRVDWYGQIDTILGYAPGEFPRTLDAWEQIIHPDDRDRVILQRDSHVKTQTSYTTEYRVKRKDGEIHYWTDKGTAMQDKNGRAYRMVGSCSDITERKMAEEAQIASEIRYRRLFEAAQDGILILDAGTGQIVDVNPFLIEMLGFSREQFLGKKIWEIGLFKDIVANKDNFKELQQQEYVRYEDMPLETADGRQIAVEFVSNVYTVTNKKVIQCNIRDINKRKLIEEALRYKNEELDGYFTNTLDLLCIADADGNFRRLNREWESALGYSPAELEGKRFLDFVHPDDMKASLDAMAELRAGKQVLQFTNRYRHRNESYRWIEWRLFPAGDLIYASARDVTERKKMTDLVEASLAEKETMLREIHHRVKNNLQIISSLLSLQINKISDPRTIEALKDSQARVMSMALVHEHLYKGEDFSRIDLRDYIHSLGTTLFQSYKSADESIHLEQEIPEIEVDINIAIPLGLIINELITNSLKYAFKEKKDGVLSITATEDAQFLNIIVGDNGSGMPKGITLENQTSLGLRLVNKLTGQLHGTVVIDSSEGTKFVFTFPKPADIPGKENLVNMLHGPLPGSVSIDRTQST
ncbi:MAG: PAS domain S-box protein [Methanoregula sp.]